MQYYGITDQHDNLVRQVEKMEHIMEKEKKLRTDGEVDLAKAFVNLQKLGEEKQTLEAKKQAALKELAELQAVVGPVADLFDAPSEGEAPRPLAGRLKCWRYALVAIIEMMIFHCIQDLYYVH